MGNPTKSNFSQSKVVRICDILDGRQSLEVRFFPVPVKAKARHSVNLLGGHEK